MSQLRIYSVKGDKHVLQNMTTLNMASRKTMKKSQVISAQECSTIYMTMEPVFCQIHEQLFKLCIAHPDLQVLFAPPLYHVPTYWHRQQLTEVATQLSTVFIASHPSIFHLLPSFTNQDYIEGVFQS